MDGVIAEPNVLGYSWLMSTYRLKTLLLPRSVALIGMAFWLYKREGQVARRLLLAGGR